MPQIKSAFKRLKQDKKKHLRNKSKMSEVRTLAKKTKSLIASGNLDEAEASLRKFESKIDKAAKTRTIRKNTASRKVSRLKKQLDKSKKK